MSFRLPLSALVLAAASSMPAIALAQGSPLGPNVLVFHPGDDPKAMQAAIDRVYAQQQHSEFGSGRYALLFAPGTYHVDVPVGFYTEVAGLGSTPDQVRIVGNVHADASLPKNNATCTFWRGASNFSVAPSGGTLQWATSQAVFFRRMHVLGDMTLHQQHGWASGGWLSDTRVDGNVDSGTQQQWISRNAQWGSWTGSNWNMVFVGVDHPPAGAWPKPPYTTVDRVPLVREKPRLELAADGGYRVVVPRLRTDTAGVSWSAAGAPDAVAATTLPLSRFHIAQATDTAATLNRALAAGKHLLFPPGTYDLTEPLRVTRPGTLVLGLGFATLHPVNGTEAMTVADVDGVTVSGLLFDAGERKSPSLLTVGTAGQHRSHAANPVLLDDIFFRVGGAAVGKTDNNLVVNSDDTIVDHTWIWRADHGTGVGWTANESTTGLLVNGNRVTIYGLFVEHHQQYQVLWNGEGGRTYFYQSEIPYDPPTQAAWSAPGGLPGEGPPHGWASYKVAAGVQQHEAWGLGVYSVFRKPDVDLTRAIEVPTTPGVRFHHMTTIALDDKGAILHVIDDTGDATRIEPRTVPKVAEYPAP